MITCLLLKVGRFLFVAIWKLSGGMAVWGDSSALWRYMLPLFCFPGWAYFVVDFPKTINRTVPYIYIYICIGDIYMGAADTPKLVRWGKTNW